MKSSISQSPLAEMGRYIAGSIGIARAKRLFAELLAWEAAQDIHVEAVQAQQVVSAKVYTEEQRNLLNAAEVEAITADGVVTPDELPRLVQLAKRERKSAEQLHTVTEMLA